MSPDEVNDLCALIRNRALHRVQNGLAVQRVGLSQEQFEWIEIGVMAATAESLGIPTDLL